MGFWDWFVNKEEQDRAKAGLAEHNRKMLEGTKAPPQVVERVARALDDQVSTGEESSRAAASAAASVPRLVTALPEIINLAGQGIDAFSVPDKDIQGNQRSKMEKFASAAYGPNGMDNIQKYVLERNKLTGETPEQIVETDTYKEFANSQKPAMRRYTEKAADAIDRAVGAPVDEDKTLREKTLTGGVQALVPTGLLINAVKGASTGAKTARVGLDMALPGTSHFSKGGVAANMALGTATPTLVEEGIKYATGEHDGREPTTVPGDGAPIPPERPKYAANDVVEEPLHGEEMPDHDKEIAAYQQLMPTIGEGLTVAAAVGASVAAPQAMRKAATEVAEQAVRRLKPEGFASAGPTRAPSTVRTAKSTFIDELAPAQQAVKDITGSTKEAIATSRAATEHARTNQTATVNDFRQNGYLEGFDKPVTSMRQFREAQTKLMQSGEATKFAEYTTAKTVEDNISAIANRTVKSIDEDVVALNAELKKANPDVKGEPDHSKIKTLEERINTNHKKLADIEADVESSRPQMRGWSRADRQRIIAEGDANPQFVGLAQEFKGSYAANLEYAVKQGDLDPELAALMKRDNPNFMHMEEDPITGSGGQSVKGPARLLARANRKFKVSDNLTAEGEELSRSFDVFKMRHDANENPVNNPLDPFDALDAHWERTIRFSERNKLRKAFVDPALQIRNDAQKAVLNEKLPKAERDLAQNTLDNLLTNFKQVEWNGQSEFSVKQLNTLRSEKGLNFDKYVSVLEGGKVKLYEFPNHPGVVKALMHGPAYSVPVLREFSAAAKKFATGSAQPGFSLTNFAMDSRSFNAQRPLDTVYGLDYLVNKMTLGKTPAFVQRAVRTVSSVSDPASYVLNLADAIHLFTLQNSKFIGTKIVDDLKKGSGMFNALAMTEGGKQVLQGFGESMVKAFDTSLTSALMHKRGGDLAAMDLGLSMEREADKLFGNINMPKWAHTVSSPAYFALQEYRIMMSAVNNAPRYGWAYRNAEMFRDASGKIPADKLKYIADNMRTMGGDFARIPGSKGMQAIDSMMPWTNVMLRSTQNMWHRMAEDPRLAAVFMSGVLAPKIYTEVMMSQWDRNSYDYYYRQMPNWKRLATIILPTPATMLAWAQGKTVPFTPDAIFETQISPEWRPLTEPVVQVMRGLGLYGAGQNDKLIGGQTMGSSMESIAEALKQSYSPMMPPVVTWAAKSANISIEPGNVFNALSGDMSKANPFTNRQPSGATTRAGEGDMLNIGSNVSAGLNGMISSLLTTTGTRLVQAYDTGEQIYRQDKDLSKAVWGATKEFVQRTAENKEDFPLIMQGNRRVYAQNPVSLQTKKMRENMRIVVGAGAVKQVGNPVLDQIAMQVKAVINSNVVLKKNYKDYKKNRDELKQLEANRQLSYNDREAAKQVVVKRQYENDKIAGKIYAETEARIDRMMGDKYKQLFGAQFSITDWANRMREANRKKQDKQ